MAKTLLITSGAVGINAGLTRYNDLAHGRRSIATAEADAEMKFRTAGTLSDLTVTVSANGVSATSTIITRVNNLDGGQSVSFTTGQTGTFHDATGTDTIAAGDDVNYKITIGAGGTSVTVQSMQCVFDATTNTVMRFTAPGGSWSTASTTFYNSYVGFLVDTATEANAQVTMELAGTFKNLFVNVFSNARSTATTLKTRLNGADGGQSLSITASTAGQFEDTTNTDAVIVDDLLCIAAVTGTGTGNLFPNFAGISMDTTTNAALNQANTDTAAGTTVNASVTSYTFIGGLIQFDTTEANKQVVFNFAPTLSNLSAKIITNGITATSTIRTRIAGVNGNLELSIGTGGTGVFVDSTHTDAPGATDLINYQIVTGASGTNLKLQYISVTSTVSGGATPKTLTASSTAIASRIRSISMIRSASSGTTAATLAQIKTLLRTLSSSSVATATLSKLGAFLKTLSVTSTAAVERIRSIQLIRSATSSATASLLSPRTLLRSLAAASIGIATEQGLRILIRALTATSSATASMLKQINLIRAVSSAATAVYSRSIHLIRAVTATGTATRLRTISIARAASSTGMATLATIVSGLVPLWRTFRALFENRTYRVPAESRTYTVEKRS